MEKPNTSLYFITIDEKRQRINPAEKISVVVNKISKKDAKFSTISRNSFYFHPDKCFLDYGIKPSLNEKFTLFYSNDEFFEPEKEINVFITEKEEIILETSFSIYTTIFQLRQKIIETKKFLCKFQLFWDGENSSLPDHLHLYDKLKEDERDEVILELVNLENSLVNVNLYYDKKSFLLKNTPLNKSIADLFDDVMDISDNF